MSFAAIFGGSGGVEVAERDVLQAGVAGIVSEDAFEGEFGFAVRIDGGFGMVLGNGDDGRFAVDRAGGGENKFADFVAGHGVEKQGAAGHVVGVEDAGFGDGFGDESFAGEMHDGVEAVLGEDSFQGGGVAEVDLVEGGRGWDGGAMAFAKVVESDDLHAA